MIKKDFIKKKKRKKKENDLSLKKIKRNCH